MTLSPKTRIAIGIVVVFLAGMFCGGLLAGKVIGYYIAKGLSFQAFSTSVLTELQKKLDLNPAQRTNVEAIVRGTEPEFKRTFDEFGNILIRMHNQVHVQLIPEQQRTHDQMLVEARKVLKDKMNFTLPDENTVPPAHP